METTESNDLERAILAHRLMLEKWEQHIRAGVYDTDPRAASSIVDEFLRSL